MTVEEKKTDDYITLSKTDDLPSQLDQSLYTEFIREGFNHFTEKQMLIYTKVMTQSSEEDIQYTETGTLKKLWDKHVARKTLAQPRYVRIHEFIKSVDALTQTTEQEFVKHLIRHGSISKKGKGCKNQAEYETMQRLAAETDKQLRNTLDIDAQADVIGERKMKNLAKEHKNGGDK